MITKNKLINYSFIPIFTVVGVVLGIKLFGSPTLPDCDSESRVNLNLSRLFIKQVEQGGGVVQGLSINNLDERTRQQEEVNHCVSQVTLRAEQNGVLKKFIYEVDFDIKWHDKVNRQYFIELVRMTSLAKDHAQPQQDISEISTLTLPINNIENVQQHDILFFATVKDGDGFVTLFKDHDQTMFIIGGKDEANHHLVSPKLVPSNAAGGSTQFEGDGVIYRIDVDGKGGASLNIHDDTGIYDVPLDTENDKYINHLPPINQS